MSSGVASWPATASAGSEPERRQRRAVAERISRWHWLLVGGVVLYAVTIPFPAYMPFSPGFRLFVANVRPPVVAAAVLGGAGWLLLRWREVPPRVRALFLASLAFPVYYLGLALVYDRIGLASVLLYFTWSLATFLVAPMFLGRPEVLRAALGAYALAMAALLLYFVVDSTRLGVEHYFEGRYSFGIKNPTYFAQIPETFVLATAAYHALYGIRGRWLRGAALLGVLAAFGLAAGARARNVMVALVVLVVLGAALRWRGRRSALLLFAYVLAGAGILATLYYEVSVIDRISSGRLGIWQRMVDANILTEDSGLRFLFGAEQISLRYTGYDELRAAKRYVKFHIDNIYLEAFIEGGAIGLVLFFLPFLRVFRLAAVRAVRSGSANWPAMLFVAMIVAVAIQGFFTPMIPSFNSPMGFFLAAFLVPLLLQLERFAGSSVVGPQKD